MAAAARGAPAGAGRRIRLAWLDAAQNSLSEARARSLVRALRAPAPRAPAPGRRQLLADVSVISRGDAGTGIQRVVRALLLELARMPPAGYELRPVVAGALQPYRHAPAPVLERLGIAAAGRGQGRLSVGPGDVYLGLDLATYNVIRHYRQFNRWCMAGAKFAFVVHDLLPAARPDWFSRKASTAYRGWIRNVAIYADAAICVSRSVRDELAGWLAQRLGEQARSVAVSRMHLGGDFGASGASTGRAPGFDRLLAALALRPSVLMAGTLEPRKGHALALDAFESLWRAGRDVGLVIAGRRGWGVDGLHERLKAHAEAGLRLHWLEDASDEMLGDLYRNCTGLLMASEAEGFGLPIVEAAQYGTPVLARDLPVFREIAGAHAGYFGATTADALAIELGAWLDLVGAGRAPASAGLAPLTWAASAQALRAALGELSA